MAIKKLAQSEDKTPTKMIAKVYDTNYRLTKKLKGVFSEDHFVWEDGGIPWLRVIPVLKKVDWVGKQRHQIACDISEAYDDVTTYVAHYHKVGDRYEQIKIRVRTVGEEKKDAVNLETILTQIELAQARADQMVLNPTNLLQLATILTAIFAIVVMIGFWYAGHSALDPIAHSLQAVNVSVSHLNSNMSYLRNLTSNLTAAYKNSTITNRILIQLVKQAQASGALP